MRCIKKQPNLISQDADRSRLEKAQNMFSMSTFGLFGSFIYSFYMNRQLIKDTANASKYLVRSGLANVSALGFFIYSMIRMDRTEQDIVKKYFSPYSLDEMKLMAGVLPP